MYGRRNKQPDAFDKVTSRRGPSPLNSSSDKSCSSLKSSLSSTRKQNSSTHSDVSLGNQPKESSSFRLFEDSAEYVEDAKKTQKLRAPKAKLKRGPSKTKKSTKGEKAKVSSFANPDKENIPPCEDFDSINNDILYVEDDQSVKQEKSTLPVGKSKIHSTRKTRLAQTQDTGGDCANNRIVKESDKEPAQFSNNAQFNSPLQGGQTPNYSHPVCENSHITTRANKRKSRKERFCDKSHREPVCANPYNMTGMDSSCFSLLVSDKTRAEQSLGLGNKQTDHSKYYCGSPEISAVIASSAILETPCSLRSSQSCSTPVSYSVPRSKALGSPIAVVEDSELSINSSSSPVPQPGSKSVHQHDQFHEDSPMKLSPQGAKDHKDIFSPHCLRSHKSEHKRLRKSDSMRRISISKNCDASRDLFTENDQSSKQPSGLGDSHGRTHQSLAICEPSFTASKNKSFLEKLDSTDAEDAQKKVLELCDQAELITFDECIPPRVMLKCVKIGEGVYGEVFTSVVKNQPVALKVIPIEGDILVNDCPQKKFDEILPEIVIARELSDLAIGEKNMSSNFCQVNRISCVQGTFPPMLLEQWDLYAKRKKSENDRPDFFTEDQLFVVFEFGNGGCALENYKFQNQREAFSVLRQVVFALAVAERELEFEHRDLHIGNVLVRRCEEEYVGFTLEGEDYVLHTEGVFATIIDFTISRLKKDGCAVFCDISTDDGLFEGTGDIQFDVYRDMRTNNGNDWEKYQPYTNILWTGYLCTKLATTIKYENSTRARADRNMRQLMRHLDKEIQNYRTCTSLAQTSELWDIT